MFGGLHRGIRLGDFAVGSDQYRHPAGITRVGVGHAESNRSRFRRVAQEIVGKFELVTKLLVGFGLVETNPQHNRVSFFKFLDSITESNAFFGSPRGIGFGVPPEKDVAAGEIV